MESILNSLHTAFTHTGAFHRPAEASACRLISATALQSTSHHCPLQLDCHCVLQSLVVQSLSPSDRESSYRRTPTSFVAPLLGRSLFAETPSKSTKRFSLTSRSRTQKQLCTCLDSGNSSAGPIYCTRDFQMSDTSSCRQ